MSGIHHITAIAGSAARTLDFYSRVLGLRLIKQTVNYDDPGTYHLYFGDETGRPGSVLTFFPWAHASAGRNGVGQAHVTAYRVPEQALGYWTHRFVEKGVAHDVIEHRFGEAVLPFSDPDGLRLALVGVPGADAEPAWVDNGIASEHAIRGFQGATLLLESGSATSDVLTNVLGFENVATDGSIKRFRARGTREGGIIDIREAPGFLPGHMGRGSVHHVAFRAASDDEQAEMRRKLVESHHLQVTEQIDRNYFRSIYFRDPGGVIFEIATDQPGFSIDEPVAKLGQTLQLPPFLEGRRAQIEARLEPLEITS